MVADVVCSQASRAWRRHLGALAWSALEELALTARRDEHGWASPFGVRAVAVSIGTTDTAVVGAPPPWGGRGSSPSSPSPTPSGVAAVATGFISPTGSRFVRAPAIRTPTLWDQLIAIPNPRWPPRRRNSTTVLTIETMTPVGPCKTESWRAARGSRYPTRGSGGLTKPPPQPQPSARPKEQP
jgi:hypothetical protein